MSSQLPTLRREFRDAMRLHNEGSHYEAHEAWEELWIDEADDSLRLFLQGLIQVTSAFHKLVYQRMPGSAGRLLERGLSKLAPYPGDYLGVDLESFRRDAGHFVALCASMEADAALVEKYLKDHAAGHASPSIPKIAWV